MTFNLIHSTLNTTRSGKWDLISSLDEILNFESKHSLRAEAEQTKTEGGRRERKANNKTSF